jgi:hypothetical protein
MKEHTFDRLITSFPSASEPSFDDERTLLSARRVVPLEKIDAKLRHRRQWFLGGAFAIAMMLGAGSALLVSYLKLRSASANDISQVEVPSATLVVQGSLPADSPVAEGMEEPVLPVSVPVTPRKEPVVKRRAVAKQIEEPNEARDEQKMSEDDQLHRIREAVLFDEWQERRARRVARRERRSQRYNHRDLSNLDEIFEGPRRP